MSGCLLKLKRSRISTNKVYEKNNRNSGSKNIMDWQEKGAVGLMAAGGVRDIDEVIRQKIRFTSITMKEAEVNG